MENDFRQRWLDKVCLSKTEDVGGNQSCQSQGRDSNSVGKVPELGNGLAGIQWAAGSLVGSRALKGEIKNSLYPRTLQEVTAGTE